MNQKILTFCLGCFVVLAAHAEQTVEQWGVYEIELNGPTNDNCCLFLGQLRDHLEHSPDYLQQTEVVLEQMEGYLEQTGDYSEHPPDWLEHLEDYLLQTEVVLPHPPDYFVRRKIVQSKQKVIWNSHRIIRSNRRIIWNNSQIKNDNPRIFIPFSGENPLPPHPLFQGQTIRVIRVTSFLTACGRHLA